jgi:uncharacterized protein (TIGR02270 family)
MPSPAEPFPDLIDESFDEAAFLWRSWERELSSLTRNLDEVWSWTEDRLQGALDGVRVAGDGLLDLAARGLRSEDCGELSVSAGVLAERTEKAAADALAGALEAAEGDRLRAMVRGLELLGSGPGLRAAASALAARGPVGAAALSRLKAHRRATMGDEVKTAYASGIPEFQADAVRAVRHAAPHQFDEMIAAALQSTDAAVRSAAAEAGLCHVVPGTWETAKRLAQPLDAGAAPYLKLLALFGKAEEHEIVYAALRVADLQSCAVWALGHIGTPRAAELCLAGMRHEKLARACGEAYCWITGADLGRDRLERQETPPEVPALDEDDLDANLVPPPETLWPLPDPDAMQKHWLARSSAFGADVRHVHGRPVTGDVLLAMVETGPMLRRPDLVLELQARSRGRYDVETRAFASRQRQMMAAGRAASAAGGGS